jgi:hypothetical protein
MLTVRIDGLDETFGKLQFVLGELSGTGAAEAGARAASEAILGHFVQGGLVPDGWVDITARTRAARRGDKTAPSLTDTGALAILSATMDAELSLGDRTERTTITPDGVVHELEGPDVRALDQGYAPNNLPARPYFTLGNDGEAAVVAAQEAWLRGVIAQAR